FFSSRRRHTRFSRDWSSDVCSSDLEVEQGGERQHEEGAGAGTDESVVEADAQARQADRREGPAAAHRAGCGGGAEGGTQDDEGGDRKSVVEGKGVGGGGTRGR